MIAITSEEMNRIDSWAINGLGIPRIALMENAGSSVTRETYRKYGNVRNILVICGKGYNSGDGLIAARHFYNSGANVLIYLTDDPTQLKPETKLNYDILAKMDIKIITDLSSLESDLDSSDIVIDAVFGTGFIGQIDEHVSNIFKVVNSHHKYYKIVSVDIPSGINGTTGEVSTNSICADMTVTFHQPKVGQYKYPASDNCGIIKIVDIGIPYEHKSQTCLPVGKSQTIADNNTHITDIQFVERVIPRRKYNAHKGDCGRIFIIAGSRGMIGAAILSGKAALRSGAGLVTIGCPKSLSNYANTMAPELIILPLPETKDETISSDAFKEILKIINKFDAMIIGPGISTNKDTNKLVVSLIKDKRIDIPIVLDADGINCAAKYSDLLTKRGSATIITPHTGELAGLLQTDIKTIQSDRIRIAKCTSLKFNCITVLKGANSVISNPEGLININPTGNPGMATAGMGDVLSGIIAALIGQGADPFNSAAAGVFIHGMAGDVVSEIKGQIGITSSDVIESIPYVIDSIIRKKS